MPRDANLGRNGRPFEDTIFRQLYDYKHGVRAGPLAAAMMPSVEKLTTKDMIALAAYAGSLKP